MDNYWIRANPSFTNAGGQGFAGAINSAILRYVGAPESDPTTSQTPSVIPLNESDLHALDNPAAVSGPVPRRCCHMADLADSLVNLSREERT